MSDRKALLGAAFAAAGAAPPWKVVCEGPLVGLVEEEDQGGAWWWGCAWRPASAIYTVLTVEATTTTTTTTTSLITMCSHPLLVSAAHS